MTDILARFNSGKLWDFDGGIHPPEMKSQSNQTPVSKAMLPERFFVPVKQHAGTAGNLLVKVGDKVLKGQALTCFSAEWTFAAVGNTAPPSPAIPA